MSLIDTLIAPLLAAEGGFVDNPLDHGGATRWGITEQLARANGYTGDMAALPRDLAIAIYRATFWTRPGLDQIATLAPAIAAELFDMGVNMGIGFAGQQLQRALNVLNRGAADYPDMPVDGHLGPVTMMALGTYCKRRPAPEGPAVLLLVVRALRTARYVAIAEATPSQEAFEYGWLARQVRSC